MKRNQELGSRLKQIREQREMSAAEAAEWIEKPLEVYQKYEKGVLAPPVPVLIKMSAILAVSLEYLARGRLPEKMPGHSYIDIFDLWPKAATAVFVMGNCINSTEKKTKKARGLSWYYSPKWFSVTANEFLDQETTMAERIEEARKQADLSIQTAAARLRLSRTKYRGIEKGERVPSLPALFTLAKVLEISVDYLATGQFRTLDPLLRFLDVTHLTPAKTEAFRQFIEAMILSDKDGE